MVTTTISSSPTPTPKVYTPNPVNTCYGTVTIPDAWKAPGAMLITGVENREDPAFQDARAKGTEVLAYFDGAEVKDTPTNDFGFYTKAPAKKLWPYPVYGQRVNYTTTHLSDMRINSDWVKWMLAYFETIMRAGRHDGLFVDVNGARFWNALSDYVNWSQAEKEAWVAGNIDFFRQLHLLRLSINPRFIIVNNNTWDAGGGYGLEAHKYINGFTLEHASPATTNGGNMALVASDFAVGLPRRMLILAKTTQDSQQFVANWPGATHFGDQSTGEYSRPKTPVVSPTRLDCSLKLAA